VHDNGNLASECIINENVVTGFSIFRACWIKLVCNIECYHCTNWFMACLVLIWFFYELCIAGWVLAYWCCLIINVSKSLLVLVFLVTLFVRYMCINDSIIEVSSLSNCRLHCPNRHHISINFHNCAPLWQYLSDKPCLRKYNFILILT